MSINSQAQLKTSYQQYQMFHIRQLCATLSKESLQRLAVQIQARIVLMGEEPVNNEAYQYVMRKMEEKSNA